ncbi:class I SAM-dependent methyltransferase [Actinoallomurus vinaceus]|uniref:Class I SAM-dependent methyltransferase n=1 Tax=Actinoallomurus vinaceus TaxID=1080074 RepID=A0ABP8UU27_9ACTN
MSRRDGHPHQGLTRPATPEELYASPPPWDIGRPQPAFLALAEAGAFQGRVLDAGCGTGEHTLLAAGLGFEATGVDLAGNALRTAERKARERGLPARFLRHDARHLTDLEEPFDTVLDSGLFHVFGDQDRTSYVTGLRAVLRPGGRFLMLGISDREPGQWGPRRLTRQEITAAFGDGWRLDSIEPSAIDVSVRPGRIEAWLVTATRI